MYNVRLYTFYFMYDLLLPSFNFLRKSIVHGTSVLRPFSRLQTQQRECGVPHPPSPPPSLSWRATHL